MSFNFSKIVLKYFRKKKYGKIKPKQELNTLEQRILEAISVGKSYGTIADELRISNEKVKKYIRSIYEKLQDKTVN